VLAARGVVVVDSAPVIARRLSFRFAAFTGPLAVAMAVASCDDCSKKKPDAEPSGGADAGDAEAGALPSLVGDASRLLNTTAVPDETVAAMVNPDKLPAYTGPTGSVEGNVYVVGDPPQETPASFQKCPDAAKTWGKAFRVGAEAKSPDGGEDARALADAIVAVTGYQGFYVPVKEEAETVTIEGCAYKKRTVTLTFGQRLEVKNLTSEFWTPRLEPSPNLVMMMAPPKGDPVRIYPKKPGHWLVTDHDRKYAVVDVYAFLHPLHDSTDLSGHYRIDGLPLGKVQVNARHPHIDAETTIDLEVRENVVHRVDLVLRHEAKDSGPIVYDAGRAVPEVR
jgi:hypothetical protein